MKYFRVVSVMLFAVTILYFNGCSKDDPVSFVDSYKVNYTEAEGTTYTGDFFPISAGYICNYTGNVDMNLQMDNPYGGDPINQNTTAPAIGMLKVLPQTYVSLPSGAVMLYPVVDLTNTGSSIVADTSRYFLKDAQSVLIKALRLPNRTFMEIENPIFIKNSLVVGDSWETAPKMDLTKLLQEQFINTGISGNMNLDAKAKFFVAGKEGVLLPIGYRNSVRLEQANDIKLNGSLNMEGYQVDINMTAKLATVYHMIADTGIAHQNTTGTMEMNVSVMGQSMNIKITMNQCELKLTGLGDGYYYGNNNLSKKTNSENQISFKTPAQKRAWEISKAIANVLIKRLGL